MCWPVYVGRVNSVNRPEQGTARGLLLRSIGFQKQSCVSNHLKSESESWVRLRQVNSLEHLITLMSARRRS